MSWRLRGGETCAFARCAVGQVSAVVLLGNSNHASGNTRTGQCGAKQILILKDGVAHDGTADNLVNKLTLEVLADESLGTQLEKRVSKYPLARGESGVEV